METDKGEQISYTQVINFQSMISDSSFPILVPLFQETSILKVIAERLCWRLGVS